MRFLVDMPLSPDLADWLTRHGHDATHASRVGLGGASDVELLDRARKQGRVLVTADLDFPRLLALTQAPAPGVIVFRGGRHAERRVIERLEAALRLIPSEELSCSIVVVEPRRIRKRRLPVRP